MSADALQASIDSLARDGRLLALMERLNRSHREEIDQLHAELAESRDGIAALSIRLDAVTTATSTELRALSQRIESVTRAVGGGLHSVPSPRRVTRYCFECEHPRTFTEGKCDHCAAEAEPR